MKANPSSFATALAIEKARQVEVPDGNSQGLVEKLGSKPGLAHLKTVVRQARELAVEQREPGDFEVRTRPSDRHHVGVEARVQRRRCGIEGDIGLGHAEDVPVGLVIFSRGLDRALNGRHAADPDSDPARVSRRQRVLDLFADALAPENALTSIGEHLAAVRGGFSELVTRRVDIPSRLPGRWFSAPRAPHWFRGTAAAGRLRSTDRGSPACRDSPRGAEAVGLPGEVRRRSVRFAFDLVQPLLQLLKALKQYRTIVHLAYAGGSRLSQHLVCRLGGERLR